MAKATGRTILDTARKVFEARGRDLRCSRLTSADSARIATLEAAVRAGDAGARRRDGVSVHIAADMPLDCDGEA